MMYRLLVKERAQVRQKVRLTRVRRTMPPTRCALAWRAGQSTAVMQTCECTWLGLGLERECVESLCA